MSALTIINMLGFIKLCNLVKNGYFDHIDQLARPMMINNVDFLVGSGTNATSGKGRQGNALQ